MSKKQCNKCNKLLELKRFRYKKKDICENCRSSKYYAKINKKKRKNYTPEKKAEYYQKNKTTIKARTSKRHIQRRKEDPLYKLSDTVRRRTKEALNRKSWKKTTKFYDYIGCTLEELQLHLENQFQSGMTWENHGFWHIDHIIPLASANTSEEMYKLCHYTNLQPLWALDNIKKGAKIKPPKPD